MDYQLITVGVIGVSGITYLTYLNHKYKKIKDKFYNERAPELVASAERLESRVKETFQDALNKIDDIEKGEI